MELIYISEAASGAKYVKKYKCPYCDLRMDKVSLISHIDKKHDEMIPEGYTASRVVFNLVNKKDHGSCIQCRRETKWDENKLRYDRICERKKCQDDYLKSVHERMMNTHGTVNLLTSKDHREEQQIKMLANRSISGQYKWSDGTFKTYTGSYEKKALEFMDLVLHCKSEDVICPGPVLEYMYDGDSHMYISDIYYAPYNLVIEVKDGGANPNTRDMKTYREKQLAKEEAIIKMKRYNYLRLTDNNFAQLLEAFAMLKLRMIDGSGDGDFYIKINEGAVFGSMPMEPVMQEDDVYIVNYGMKNTFGDYDKLAVSRFPDLSNLVGLKGREDIAEIEEYAVYRVENAKRNYFDYISAVNDGAISTNEEAYEILTGKKLYNMSQLRTTLESVDFSFFVEQSILESSLLFSNQSDYWLDIRESGVPGISICCDKDGYFYKNDHTFNRSKSYNEYASLAKNKDSILKVLVKEDILL